MSTKNQTTSPKKQNIEWQLLLSIREIIFSLNKENIKKSANLLFSKSVNKCTYSFSLIVSQMIYAFYETIIGNIDFIFDFLKEIKTYEENNNKTKIFELFTQHVLNNDATYLLYNMVENHLLDPSILEKQKNKNNEIQQTEDEIALKNKLIKEGVNPDEIATIIRNDEIEKLQEITSQSNFNYSQQIVSTIYERYSFIKQTDVTLIDYAAFFGATKCFKLLLMNEANIENAGMFAVAGGNLEIVHLCEQNHSTFKGAYETVIRFNRNDIFKYLYENKIGDIPNLTNLGRNCVLYHNYEILTFLYKEGMKINDNIINEAALKGNIFLVKYFLKRIQIPKDILFASVKSENIELIKFVLEHDEIDVNEQDEDRRTVLIEASFKDNIEIIKILIDQLGIDVNAQDKFGWAPLIAATSKGYLDIVKLLLEQEGIDVNAKDYCGKTALMHAAENGYIEIAKLLLQQKGIDINAADHYEQTALYWAVKKGKIEVVQLLLELNVCDINVKDIYGWTPLMQASQKGFTEIVKLLVEQKGIDITIKNKNGQTALMLATANHHTKIPKLLKKSK